MEDTANWETTTAADQAEIARLKEGLSKEHERYVRLLADFDNYRRRIERERADTAHSGKREIILSLLELVDDFDRALPHTDGAPSLSEGFNAIRRKLIDILDAQGVTPFDSAGETFNPALHEALGVVSSDRYESGTVVEEVRRGYRWGDEVLRTAGVLVAR